jgi:hypothetical protein
VQCDPEADGIVIEPSHVSTHLTTWNRPANTYCREAVLIICWALNRGRR